MESFPKIKVVGLGGCGVNIVSELSKYIKSPDIEIIASNTDFQSLKVSPVKHKILLGPQTTFGFGTGMNLKLGEKAARESLPALETAIKGTDLLFLTCGLGGGTGTSASLVLGDLAQKLNILTIALVTTPFSFEGAQRQKISNLGLAKLANKVDSIIPISNDKLSKSVDKNISLKEAFEKCDKVLLEAISSISDLIYSPGIINVNFGDIKQVLKKSGRALLGQGVSRGENRVLKAAEKAVFSPLIEFPLKNAKGMLLNVAGSDDLTLFEVRSAAEFLRKLASREAKIIFGASEDKRLKKGEIKVTVIATGF